MGSYHKPIPLADLLSSALPDAPAPAASTTAPDPGLTFLGYFQRALELVTPPRQSYVTRARRLGRRNPSFTSGRHTNKRRNREREFSTTLTGLDGAMDTHMGEWKIDRFHPRVRAKAAHLWALLKAGLGKEGLCIPRTAGRTGYAERLEGVFLIPKVALPLVFWLIWIARQLTSLLENLAVTGNGTGACTTRTDKNERREPISVSSKPESRDEALQRLRRQAAYLQEQETKARSGTSPPW